ncbi:hypothetical protein CASFOL_028728 [Castilleja foliolosa]|uniref:ATP-dependent DNA helicase n=1 Tax=Castilleja foliolosa TaxID=1961234 RepID=A0ABD3CBZ3_9LAMI
MFLKISLFLRNYHDVAKLEEELKVLIPKLTDEQRHVFEVVLDSVNCNKGKTFFLYGYGGTGKNVCVEGPVGGVEIQTKYCDECCIERYSITTSP